MRATAGNAPVKGAAGTSRRETLSNFPTISPSLRGVTTSLANPRRERAGSMVVALVLLAPLFVLLMVAAAFDRVRGDRA